MISAPRGFGVFASVALHGVIAALLILWPVAEELSGDPAETQGVAVIYEELPDGSKLETHAAAPEVAAAPPRPEVPPPPPAVPPPPSVAEAPPTPPAPAVPPPPVPLDLAELALPPPPAPVAEPPPALTEKPPEPATPTESPGQVAETPPERRPPSRPSAPQTASQPVRLNAALQGMEGFTLEGRISPPEALDNTRNRRPVYPDASRRRGEEGVVRVELLVDPSGRVADVRLLESSGFSALDAAALQTLREWRFRPAQRAGLPVAGSITTAVHFRLANERR